MELMVSEWRMWQFYMYLKALLWQFLISVLLVYNFPMHSLCTFDFSPYRATWIFIFTRKSYFSAKWSMHNANDLHCLCPSQFILLRLTDSSFATTSMSTFVTRSVNFWYLIYLEISNNSHRLHFVVLFFSESIYQA